MFVVGVTLIVCPLSLFFLFFCPTIVWGLGNFSTILIQTTGEQTDLHLRISSVRNDERYGFGNRAKELEEMEMIAVL